MANNIPPTLHPAQDRLHRQMDNAVDRFHKQNDASQHLVEDGFHADDQALDAAQKQAVQGLAGDAKHTVEDGFHRQRDALHRRRSGLHKAVDQQNHAAEDRLKSGFHQLDEQGKREGRLPTAAELQNVIGDTGAAPYINQLTPELRPPQYQGQEYCGPTVMAMIARQRGLAEGVPDSQLIEQFARIGGTSQQTGTTGQGMIAIGQQMGLQSRASKGADFNFIDAELAQGRPVVALGDFYSLPPHADPGKDAGHYILVQSRDALGNYRVSDPQTDKVTVLTQDALRSYMNGLPTGGFALSFS